MTVRTLKTRKDGKPASHAPGSPNWRKAGRDASKMDKAEPEQPGDTSDLDGKGPEELKTIAEQTALRALIGQTRNPTRHATAITSAARTLLDFSSQKPVQKQEVDHGGAIEFRVSTVKRD